MKIFLIVIVIILCNHHLMIAQNYYVKYKSEKFNKSLIEFSELLISDTLVQFLSESKPQLVKGDNFEIETKYVKIIQNYYPSRNLTDYFLLDDKKNTFRSNWIHFYEWEILPDTTKILGYLANKATTEIMVGSKPEIISVWFTSQIPISAGPFMLNGLPGLILKVEYQNFPNITFAEEIKIIDNISFKELPEARFIVDKEIIVNELNRKKYLKELPRK